MCFQQITGMCLIAVALLVCQWTVVRAVRDEAAEGKKRQMPTEFASCICNAHVEDNKEMFRPMPVIIVTQYWDEEAGSCKTTCGDRCKIFDNDATFNRCLVVHTADGTTGTDPAKHGNVRPNTVDPSVKEASEADVMKKMMKMTRHETYHSNTKFAACSCQITGDIEEGSHVKEEFLAGDSALYGGLQVWGRTGCSKKTCTQACRPLGADGGDCIMAAMTKVEISEIPSLGLNGFETEQLSLNLNKRLS